MHLRLRGHRCQVPPRPAGRRHPPAVPVQRNRFHQGHKRFAVQQVPWDREDHYDMPVSVWRDLVDLHFPNTGGCGCTMTPSQHSPLQIRARDARTRRRRDRVAGDRRAGRPRLETHDASWDRASAVADAVLYEGYLLYPYRATSGKNQSRWQFGVLGPPRAAERGLGEDDTLVGPVPHRGGPAITAGGAVPALAAPRSLNVNRRRASNPSHELAPRAAIVADLGRSGRMRAVVRTARHRDQPTSDRCRSSVAGRHRCRRGRRRPAGPRDPHGVTR